MDSEKTNWKTEYKRLKQKLIASSEKDLIKLFPFTKTTTLKNEILLMITNQEKHEFEEQKQKEEIYSNLSSIKREIKQFKEKIRLFDRSDESIRKIKEITEIMEQKMTRFQNKQIQDFEDLSSKEEQLTTDLDIFSSRLENYDRKAKEKTKIAKYNVENQIKEVNNEVEDNDNEFLEEYNDEINEKNDLNSSENEINIAINEDYSSLLDKEIQCLKKQIDKFKIEIENIDKLIRNIGGKTCGWPDDDHNDFLKIKTKHKNQLNKLNFLQDCISSLPLYNINQIQEHVEKYKKFLELDEKKKNCFDNYKNMKRELQEKTIIKINKEEQINKENKNINEKKKIDDMIERNKLKEKIKEWKTKKKIIHELHSEKQTDREIEKNKENQEKLQKKREEMALKLKEFKEIKEQEKINKQEREEYQKLLNKKNLDPYDLERIKYKEEKILERKKILIESKKSKQNERKILFEKLEEDKKNKFSYIESKLDHITTAILTKKSQKFDPQRDKAKIADTFGGMIGKGPSRAIPSWRKGI